jgi:hypothetical protein
VGRMERHGPHLPAAAQRGGGGGGGGQQLPGEGCALRRACTAASCLPASERNPCQPGGVHGACHLLPSQRTPP